MKHPEESRQEAAAKAIYMTHRKFPAPVWEDASAEVKNWVRAQAASVLALELDDLRAEETTDAMWAGTPVV